MLIEVAKESAGAKRCATTVPSALGHRVLPAPSRCRQHEVLPDLGDLLEREDEDAAQAAYEQAAAAAEVLHIDGGRTAGR